MNARVPYSPLLPTPTQPWESKGHPCLTFSGHCCMHQGPSRISLYLLLRVRQQIHQDRNDIVLPHLVLALQRDAKAERRRREVRPENVPAHRLR